MQALIVNADDFGLTLGVNRAVIDAHAHGLITSTTIMANMPAFAEAAQLAATQPALGVGLHFNITQGAPVAPAADVRSLLNQRGEFLGTSTALAQRALAGRLRRAEVALELRAQIEKALAAGLRLTHIDSHKHAHALPPVCAAIIETLGAYHINAVRLPRERVLWVRGSASWKVFTQSAGAAALAQLCRVAAGQLQRAGIRMPDAFFGVAQTGFWDKAWLLHLLAHLPAGVSELMCHPGYEDEALGRVQTRLRAARATELRLLTDPEVIAAVRAHSIELVNYAQFGASA